MSLDPERTSAVYPGFAWFETADWPDGVGDGALAADIRSAMNGRRLGEDAPFDLTEDERVWVQPALAG